MKAIVGRYILNHHQEMPYLLPEDFIDLKRNRIVWHSDGSLNHLLLLQYEKDRILLSLRQEEESKKRDGSIVRIRTNGSDYGCYYQEFIAFYEKLKEVVSKQKPKTKVYEKRI